MDHISADNFITTEMLKALKIAKYHLEKTGKVSSSFLEKSAKHTLEQVNAAIKLEEDSHENF